MILLSNARTPNLNKFVDLNQEASVFLFEKKSVDRFQKRDKELIIESLRRGVQQLTKLRHPRILSVIHPLEETRYAL